MKYLSKFNETKAMLENIVLVDIIEKEYDFFHISTTKLGSKFVFTPRIPDMPFTDYNADVIEDNYTYRISLAKSIQNCLNAITDEEVDGYYVYGVKTESMDKSSLLDLSSIKCPIGYGQDFILKDWLKERGIVGDYYSVDKLPIDIRKEFYGCVPDIEEIGEFWYFNDLEMKYLGEVQPWKYGRDNLIIEHMRYLKSFNEDITNIEDESYILKKKFIDKYVQGVCNVDNLGRYSVDGDVIINNYKNSTLPIEFSNVSGSFHISASDIYDLSGCPGHVGGDFFIFKCEYINSLSGCPGHVGGDFYLCNNDFTKVDYLPNYVGGDIDLHRNGIIEITTNFPGYVGGHIINLNNNKLFEVDFDIFNLRKNNINDLFLKKNQITNLKNVPSGVVIYLDGNDLPEQLQTYIDVDIINYDPKVINMLGDYDLWKSDGSLNTLRYSLFLKDNNIR